MTENNNIIYIIDDNPSVRQSLSLFLNTNGFHTESYSSAEEFESIEPTKGTGCIILDYKMDGKSGLELQEDLNDRKSHLPVIFITGYGNVKLSVAALKHGAVNFLEKPFSEKELLQCVNEALDLSREILTDKLQVEIARQLISGLTPREFDVLKYTIGGALNKQIGYELGISEHTIKLHRQNICKKLKVKSLADLISIAQKARIEPVKINY